MNRLSFGRTLALVVATALPWLTTEAQSLAPQAALPAGGHGVSGDTYLSWSVGQASGSTYTGGGVHITAGVQQPEGVLLAIGLRSLLDGPYSVQDGLMHDSLRRAGLLPLTEPYTGLGFTPSAFDGGERLQSITFLQEGPDAIVDWVWVELLDANAPQLHVANLAALLQRDGDVVARDGVSPVRFPVLPGSYYVAVHHRNHLPVYTAAPVALSHTPMALDFSDGSAATYGTAALRSRDGKLLHWAGDVNGDGTVRYTGEDNDRDPILQNIGGVVPTASATGYLPTDVNLDGKVRYTGQDNDRDPVLQTIGGVVPTSTRAAQLP